MKTLRYLLRQVPWVALGAVLGAATVWLLVRPPDRQSLPTPAAQPQVAGPLLPAETREREREVGARLRQVQPGMTRREVEQLLGPPGREDWRQFTGRWRPGPDSSSRYEELPYLVYYCSPPDLPPGPHMMTVVYEGKPFYRIEPLSRVVEVGGPHGPE